MHTLKLLVFLSFLAAACSTTKPEGKTEAEVLFKEAKILMDDNRYLLATEKLNQIKNKFPYSYYATPSELLQADILFKQENYVEAAAAYLLFRDFHPKHPRIDYVVYRIAESYYKQMPDTYDRDLQSASQAIKYFREVIDKYPQSQYIKNTRKKIKSAEEKIRKKERYIADFYFKTEVYDAARWRYLDILDNFSYKPLRQHSMTRIILSSYKLKDYDSCKKYYQEYRGNLDQSYKELLGDAIEKCKL